MTIRADEAVDKMEQLQPGRAGWQASAEPWKEGLLTDRRAEIVTQLVNKIGKAALATKPGFTGLFASLALPHPSTLDPWDTTKISRHLPNQTGNCKPKLHVYLLPARLRN